MNIPLPPFSVRLGGWRTTSGSLPPGERDDGRGVGVHLWPTGIRRQVARARLPSTGLHSDRPTRCWPPARRSPRNGRWTGDWCAADHHAGRPGLPRWQHIRSRRGQPHPAACRVAATPRCPMLPASVFSLDGSRRHPLSMRAIERAHFLRFDPAMVTNGHERYWTGNRIRSVGKVESAHDHPDCVSHRGRGLMRSSSHNQAAPRGGRRLRRRRRRCGGIWGVRRATEEARSPASRRSGTAYVP